MQKLFTFCLFLLLNTLIFTQTTNTYFESFTSNDASGWGFLSTDAIVTVQNGTLSFSSANDQYIQIIPPIGATKDDFSVTVKGYGNSFGGIGRVGFNTLLFLHIEEDSLYLIYSEDVQNYLNPNLTWLTSYPMPDTIITLGISADRSGSDLNVTGYVNGSAFYNGLITNADEGLFNGQIYFELIRTGEPVYFDLEEIEIDYNPYLPSAGSYMDDFNSGSSPIFKFGDLENAMQSITINNGRLNFNYNQTPETQLLVILPTGAVKDFTLETAGGAGGNHNCPFGISRFFDYRNYITIFYEDDSLYLGYALNSFEPTILDIEPMSGITINTIKMGAELIGGALQLTAWVNGQQLLSASINNPPPVLTSGHLAVGYERGNYSDAYLDYINVVFSEFVSDAEIDEQNSGLNFQLGQNYPNPFNPVTTINYNIAGTEQVKLTVFDLLGREVKLLVNEEQHPGSYSVNWNAAGLPSGIYFYRLNAGNYSQTKKLMLLK